ncbi:hypothetical protein QBC43DRAFT_337283 [Cladorrhinum sp. PSN259]|nr:hypothetical protein QBC43DRAFT_337283 [Cladorrhinum sp. PSN259]
MLCGFATISRSLPLEAGGALMLMSDGAVPTVRVEKSLGECHAKMRVCDFCTPVSCANPEKPMGLQDLCNTAERAGKPYRHRALLKNSVRTPHDMPFKPSLPTAISSDEHKGKEETASVIGGAKESDGSKDGIRVPPAPLLGSSRRPFFRTWVYHRPTLILTGCTRRVCEAIQFLQLANCRLLDDQVMDQSIRREEQSSNQYSSLIAVLDIGHLFRCDLHTETWSEILWSHWPRFHARWCFVVTGLPRHAFGTDFDTTSVKKTLKASEELAQDSFSFRVKVQIAKTTGSTWMYPVSKRRRSGEDDDPGVDGNRSGSLGLCWKFSTREIPPLDMRIQSAYMAHEGEVRRSHPGHACQGVGPAYTDPRGTLKKQHPDRDINIRVHDIATTGMVTRPAELAVSNTASLT